MEDSIENPLDISNLFESLASDFAGVVQYSKDNRRAKTKPADIDDVNILFVSSVCTFSKLRNSSGLPDNGQHKHRYSSRSSS